MCLEKMQVGFRWLVISYKLSVISCQLSREQELAPTEDLIGLLFGVRIRYNLIGSESRITRITRIFARFRHRIFLVGFHNVKQRQIVLY